MTIRCSRAGAAAMAIELKKTDVVIVGLGAAAAMALGREGSLGQDIALLFSMLDDVAAKVAT